MKNAPAALDSGSIFNADETGGAGATVYSEVPQNITKSD